MKTIGLIGGITWHSTLDYYRMLNESVNQQLGGVASARIILYSVNFSDIKEWTENDRWDLITAYITAVALKLQAAGADCIVIAANTMHKVADDVQEKIKIPLIHIAEATAQAIKEQKLRKVALLGTKYVMELDFYKHKLVEQGITAIIPNEEDRLYINNAIYSEMGKGLFLEETKTRFLRIIRDLVQEKAQGIILGCTEIPILIKPEDCSVPVFDTASIHVQAGLVYAMNGDK